eukprot:9450899-Heterocapsa_arctica.AAC.1
MAETGRPAQVCKSQDAMIAQNTMGLRKLPVARSGRPVYPGACSEGQAPPELNRGEIAVGPEAAQLFAARASACGGRPTQVCESLNAARLRV